jgi:dihydrofolate synthase/folylpolyglutamate synthase
MNFKESVEYLFGLGYELSVKKFGLENTYTLLDALGNPQNKFLKVQVAGTNGKGSTCAFLESILVEAGIKVGVNTSPHLVSVTERIRINGNEISEEKFAEYVTKVGRLSKQLVKTGKLSGMPTFFEHITAIAQMVFADEGVEVAILETGLGGRFDATTATGAEIVAITPIDLDHTKTLGETIELIAGEKAAIIRSDTKVLLAPQKSEAKKVILEKCREVGANPIWSKDNVEELNPEDNNSNGLCYQTDNDKYSFNLSLSGRHQRMNAALAIHLAETVSGKGFAIAKKEIENGLGKAKHKGRLEYSNGILFDGAHNVSGAKALREYIQESINQPIVMIFGVMGGKNLGEISPILFTLADHLILTTPENPRAMPAGEIAAFVPDSFPKDRLFVIDEIPLALEKARALAADGNLILVTGSLYLIGEIQAHLRQRKVERRKKKKK